jgi:hypothetical protein
LIRSRKEVEEYRLFFELVWFVLVVEKILPQRKKKGKKRKKADAWSRTRAKCKADSPLVTIKIEELIAKNRRQGESLAWPCHLVLVAG